MRLCQHLVALLVPDDRLLCIKMYKKYFGFQYVAFYHGKAILQFVYV